MADYGAKNLIFLLAVSLASMTMSGAGYWSDAVPSGTRLALGGRAVKLKEGKVLAEAEKLAEEVEGQQEEAVAAYHEIVDTVYDEKTESYDDNYAGTYLNEAGELIVQVQDKEETDPVIEEIVKDNDQVFLEETTYPYSKLEEVYQEIGRQMEEEGTGREAVSNITSTELSQSENRVIVYLEDCSRGAVQEFQAKVMEDGCISFRQGEAVVPTAGKTVYPGQEILIGTKSFSMGFRAYYNGAKGKMVKGLVTAGHMVKKGESVYVHTSNGNKVKIGTVAYRKTGGNLDVAFIKLTNSKYGLGRKVYYKGDRKCSSPSGIKLSSSSWGSSLPEGTKVFKAGFTGYCTGGTIISSNATIKYDLDGDGKAETTIKNMYKASYKSKNGDSGGIVYDTNKCPVGIHSGSMTPDNTGYNTVSYFTSMDYIMNLPLGKNKDGLFFY